MFDVNMKYYIYIIHSKRSSLFYIGHTEDPERRLSEHNSSLYNTYTSKYRPWVLVALFYCTESRSEAIKVERFIKKQRSKHLINKLIEPDFTPVGKLAQLIRIPHIKDPGQVSISQLG